MTPYRDRNRSSWRIFPAQKTVALYDSFSQHIELCEIDSSHLHKAMNEHLTNPVAALPILPLLFHEFRHWIDNVSSLWGQKRLVASFNAMNARSSEDPKSFHHLISYHRLVSRDSFGSYFTTIGKTDVSHSPTPRWMFQYSCGKRFDSDGCLTENTPIFFTNFNWQSGEHACRVPFSVSSLIETTAMSTELEMRSELLSRIDPIVSRIDRSQFDEELESALYDPRFGIYTTAVHSVANILNINDPHKAYALASALAAICLNLPESLFSRLNIPPRFQPWGSLCQNAIEGKDRGFAFLALLEHSDHSVIDDVSAWVETALSDSGLPNISEIANIGISERQDYAKEILDGPYKQKLTQLLGIGNQIHSVLGISCSFRKIYESLTSIIFPPVLCSDLGWNSLGPSTPQYSQSETEEWCFKCDDFEKQFNEFVSVCGI